VKVLITGAAGQLGYALQKTAPCHWSDDTPVQLLPMTRASFDLNKPDALAAQLDVIRPDAVINAGAYTAVDKAEADEQQAERVNAHAVGAIARWCQHHKIPLIQISTDFVFDGKKSSPYLPEDQPNPLSVYARTKHAGEINALANCDFAYVVRSGWVYGEQGANFVKTMLRLAAERETLAVVSDQVGTPTYAINLSQMIWQLLQRRPAQKVFHFSDAGVASWYDFAVAIFCEAHAQGILHKFPQVIPINTSDYPTSAQRPAYSVLDKQATWHTLDIEACHWRTGLKTMLEAYKKR
jgi:dTDP-4-dehydrorhamnose reductase